MDFKDPLDGSIDSEQYVDLELIFWIRQRITLTGFSPDHWREEFNNIVTDFLASKNVNKLLMFIDDKTGLLQCVGGAEAAKAHEIQYFLKAPGDVILTQDHVADRIQFGLIAGSALDSLLRLMNRIYLPTFLSNQSWPDSVKKEFSGQLHKFMASLTETANQSKGQTVLYLPDEDLSAVERSAKDKDLVKRLQTILIHWTRQIKEVISNQEASNSVDNDGPLEEIKFWRSRTVDLSGIRQQLERPGVKAIVAVLQAANSDYLDHFSTLSDSIQQGSMEANDNLMFLSTLQESCEQLANSEPKDIPSILKNVLMRIRMIWSISKFYNKVEPLTGLLRKVSNQIIIQCKNKINLREIFDGDVEQSMNHLHESIQCGVAWKKIFDQTKRAVEINSRSKWDFDPSSIFAQIDAFVQRCRDLLEVCEGQVLFARKSAKLPKGQKAPLPVFGGSRGPDIEKSLYEIEDAFEKYIDRLRNLDYDIMDVKATKWHDDYNFYTNGVKDLEVMITNVITSAFEAVSTLQAAVELLEAFYHLSKRPSMKQVIERQATHVFEMFKSELESVQKDYLRHRQRKYPPVPPSHPRLAGTALWARGMLQRITKQMRLLDEVAIALKPHQYEEAQHEYSKLVGSLEEAMKKAHSEWCQPFQSGEVDPDRLAARLEIPLLVRASQAENSRQSHGKDNKTSTAAALAASLSAASTANLSFTAGKLEVNFDHSLLRLFNEVRYWQKFNGEYNVPYVAQGMTERAEHLRILRENVMLVVRDYNIILDSLSAEERRLFAEHLRRVDRKIAPGLTKLTWTSKMIKESFVKQCREQCREVYDIVLKYHENHKRVMQLCRRISSTMLIEITKNQVYDESQFEDSQLMHQERVRRELHVLHQEILSLMRGTFQFFKSDPASIQREWAAFVRKIDKQVEDALRTTVKRSLQELARAINFDAQSEPHDLFKVNVVLDEPKARIEFRPTMQSLQSMVNNVAKQLITTVQVIPRLAEELGTTPEKKIAIVTPSGSSDDVHHLDTARAEPSSTDEDHKSAPAADSASAASAAALQQSFYDIISNDDDVLKVLVAIMNGVNAIAADLQQLIKPWEAQNYRQIWEPDKEAFIRRYALTKRNAFQRDIQQYRDLQAEIQSAETLTSAKFIRVDFSQLKQALVHHCVLWQQRLTALLHSNANTELNSLHSMFLAHTSSLQRMPENLDQLGHSITLLRKIQADLPNIEARFEPLDEMYKLLDRFDVHVPDEEKEMLDNVRPEWSDFQDMLKEAENMLNSCKVNMKKDLEESLSSLNNAVTGTRAEFLANGPFAAPSPSQGDPDVDTAFKLINDFKRRVQECRTRAQNLAAGLEIFNIEQPSLRELDDTTKDLEALEGVWLATQQWMAYWQECKVCKFTELKSDDMDKEAQKFQKNLTKLNKATKLWKVSVTLKERVDQFRAVMPLIKDLSSPALRPRHWDQLKEEIQQYNFDPKSDEFTLDKIFQLGIHMHAEAISNLSSVANRELNLETALDEIQRVWDSLLLDIVPHKDNQYYKMRSTEEVSQFLEDHQVSLGTMKNSPFYSVFAQRINYWSKALNEIAETIEMILNVQRQWMYLESIFIGSEDIRRQLPSETIMFEAVNKNFYSAMSKMFEIKYAIRACREPGLLDKLTHMNETLEKIQKSLDQYLEQKRQDFPRFYFLSNDDLLEILGQSRDPLQVQKHIRKCFAGIKVLELVPPFKAGNRTWEAAGMKSAEGESVAFNANVQCEGAVEVWLNKVENAMFITLQRLLRDAVAVVQKPNSKKDTWIKGTIGQHLVTSGQISWTAECTRQLNELHKNKKALRTLYARWNQYLERLATYIRGNLSAVDRLKLVALITIELHARDVIEEMARASNITGATSFDWLKQLRFYFDKDDGEYGICLCKQTSTSFRYGYEYQGNAPRLVVTSLTDRCYMTLTTALHLNRGGAPQGPAGTGKTETVKDLGKGLAKYVVVFNCSDGMDFLSIGQSFSGLVQTGAWGCFDEFNRIDIEVLSVVGQQVSTILNAIAEKKSTFIFEGKQIPLNPTCGIFITMNPGYAGRSELPDNLKSLFRPVSMMLPEFIRIAEVALHSEGFKTAGELARKLVTLYDLMKQQFSKQDHYDFGMRAVKSVLNRAGQLFRADQNAPEEILLMRALRDMNVSKLVTEDVPLFQGLFQDLFPNTELPENDSGSFQDEVKVQLEKAGLQPYPSTIKKVVQLYETKLTRHGNMLVGATLAGKSTAWKILLKTMNSLNKSDPRIPAAEVHILNPKSITIDELFGVNDLATREWTDGVLSNIMRKVCMDESDKEKWIVLDGPVDTLWIESMNTVLDDNKILTLLNGDRIALPPQVSLLFEVEDLSVASPATVSRAGMVYINAADLGWRPFVESWLASQPRQDVRDLLTRMFEKQVSTLLEVRRRDCRELIPVSDFHAVRSCCTLFDALNNVENGVDPADTETYLRMVEMSFLLAIIWSVGASVDSASRAIVDKCLRESEIVFPPLNSVYDYGIDAAKKEWAPWDERVPKGWRPNPGTPFHRLIVPTIDTARNGFIVSALTKARAAVMVVGSTGTGKTSLVSSVLNSFDESSVLCLTINFSSATSAKSTQEIIESRLEKRQRNNFGPKNGKSRLVCFVDDLNMPRKEKFGAQPPLELLRQWIDYGMWYETHKQQQRQIIDMQLITAMGPPGGARSVITRRLLSRFNLLNLPFPSDDQIKRIFESIISDKLQSFGEEIKPLSDPMTVATIELYKNVVSEFLPTPSKSHYLFNLRDISKVFQGLLQSDKTFYDSKEVMIKLWVHECMRVFHDRLIDNEDRQTFKGIVNAKLQSHLNTSWTALFGENGKAPLFSDFISDLVTSSDQKEPYRIYQEIVKRDEARKLMEERLEELNGEVGVAPMDLVLFEDAIEHCVRIYRVLRQSRGNLMLVGVGGSGRQSLTRLAAYMAELKVKLLDIRKGYRVVDWRNDLKALYQTVGVEKEELAFMFLDSQIQHESFLEDINNILSSGEITNLFPADELQPILDAVKPDCIKENRGETGDAVYAYFIDRVRNNLHLVLCMSPVGDGFRERCRMYPALVNNTSIDWFSEWPDVALREVSARFLMGADLGSIEKIQEAMAEVFCRAHLSVSNVSKRMAAEIRRYNYVTPTNYLDLVKGYKSLLGEKRQHIGDMADKLRNGLSKLDEARVQVAEMSVSLEHKKKIVAQKKAESEKMLIEIVQQQRNADEQKKTVESEAVKIEAEEKECTAFAADAQKDLDAAEPELRAAQDALDALKKDAITEVRSYAKPLPSVEKVLATVMTILGKDPSWASAKKEMSDPSFLNRLKSFKAEDMSTNVLKIVSKRVTEPDFDPEAVKSKSLAAGALAVWCVAMQRYVTVFRNVAPKRAALQAAMDSLESKRTQMAAAKEKLRQVIEFVNNLQEKYEKSENEKNSLRKEALDLETKLKRAGELVSGLGGERSRWEVSIAQYEEQLKNLIGDCAVAAAFRSYAGPFPAKYRNELVSQSWLATVRALNIPCTPDFSFAYFLASPSDVMSWSLEGLPVDDFSIENGVLVTRGRRWPLMIDPQGQANAWLKNREGKRLNVIDSKMNASEYLRILENAMAFGTPTLMQDLGEELDPSIDPLLVAGVVPKGTKKIIRFNDKEVEISPEFRFFMTSKMQNPHYTPEVSTKTTIVNFAVTAKGLEDQFLGVVFNREEAKLEEDKQRLVTAVTAGKRKLVELEDKILSLLRSASGSLLDDETLINTLNSSKTISEEVKEQLKVSEENERKIDATREGYRPVAARASILFFVLNDLALVDPMYQFSLDAYTDLFKDSIVRSRDAKSVDNLQERIATLNNYHTESVYKFTCRGLFEKHKLLFSFLMCIRKMQAEQRVNNEEYEFFLKGAQIMDRSERPANPTDWLDESTWDNICELDKLAAFKNLVASFDQIGRDWKKWYRSDDPPPEKALPGDWGSKLDELQVLLLLRALRPDRVMFAARSFIAANLGPVFVDPPEVKLAEVFATSTCYTPIIFVLSPGVDPMVQLTQLAKNVGQEIEAVSLGQGQTPIALRCLDRGLTLGKWVFFANCHLSISWMPELEKLVQKFCSGKPHENFRLWLSSDPHPKFPISILQRSIKLTTEPPKGLRNNMSRLYNNITTEQFGKCNRPERYKKLLFSLCWFHALLLERRKFQSLGWNVMYDFNDSDFSICENLLTMYLSKDVNDKEDESVIPWDAMKYLIAEANYGGRVTDDRDRRLLRVYINQFFQDAAIQTSNYPLSSLPNYFIPEDGTLQSYRDFVKTFPANGDHPEAFGQHPNAEISALMVDTNTLLSTLIALQPRSVEAGAKSPEQLVQELCVNLESSIPQPLDLAAISKKHEGDTSPLKVVLVQEIARYNNLLVRIHRSLADLQKGLKGLVVISSELEMVFDSLYSARVPEMWMSAYPSIKPLGPWVRDLVARVDQLRKWADEAVPKVFWLSGFTFPSAFLTALQQSTSRRNGIPIDILGWEFVILNQDEASITVYPKEGAYIKGLVLEGARWDYEYGCLADASPMELNCPMPIIHFKPVEAKRRSLKGIYQCPLYIWPVRGGTMQFASFIMYVELKCGAKDAEHWTKRGAALLLSLAN